MAGKTPMMRQYNEIKKQYPNAILFFRLGDFYEMFGEDAQVASRELEITLTGRDAGMKERIPMCGVPYHAAESHIARLIQKGYKVAVCEQVEDPRTAKGIVKREVVRVITPGTVLDSQLLEKQTSTYLTALCYQNYAWGLSVCDVSTGEFWIAEFNGISELQNLKDELSRLNATELLLPTNLQVNELFPPMEQPVLTYLAEEFFSYRQAEQTILRHFKVNSLEALGCRDFRAAVSSAGAVLNYLQDTQKLPPQQIKTLKLYSPDNTMVLDQTTMRNLELVRTNRFNEKKGSLLDILDKTKTALGGRLLRQWLERPLCDLAVLNKRQMAVEVLCKYWTERQELRAALDEVYDLERIMTRVLYQRAMPKELISLKNSLAVLPALQQTLLNLEGSQYIAELSESLDTLEDICSLLEKAVVDDPPYNLKDGGVIKAGYSQEVDRLRAVKKDGREWIAQLESREREKTGIKSLKVGFNRVFGYYLEVTKANLALVPEYYQRKQTLANGERYVTEELLSLESQVVGAEEKLLALEETLYLELLLQLGERAGRVQHTSKVLAQLDVLQSLAEVAVQNNYVKPTLYPQDENRLHFINLRHPVVEKASQQQSYVPNNLEMGSETELFIVTGPNMAGKSTYCRSVALAVIMAQIGSFVPAERAELALRDRVFARIGASDDLASGHSTYMVEMNEVANILNQASSGSLVILDEVGRGTSTYDGLSMAWAVSEYLIKNIHAKTLFATHYHELTQLEQLYSAVSNISVAVKEKGEEIIFLYKIIAGAADKSYGIQVGRLAGLPETVIRRAKEVLNALEKEQLNQEVGSELKEFTGEYEQPEELFSPELVVYLSDLKSLALDTYSPLEALNKLYEIQETIKKLTT